MKITSNTSLLEIQKQYLEDFKKSLSSEEFTTNLDKLIKFTMSKPTVIESILRLKRINCIHDDDDDEQYDAYTYRHIETPTERDIAYFRSRPENSKWKYRYQSSDYASKFVIVMGQDKVYFDVFDKTKLTIIQSIAEELISNYGIETHINLYAEYEPDLYSRKEVRKMKIASLSFSG